MGITTSMTTIYVRPKQSRFQQGELYVTSAADRRIGPSDIAKGLARHAQGDWGGVSEADRAANKQALPDGERLHSVYRGRGNVQFWIITEWDRRATTVLLPDDY
jgi:hypothetical protein